MILNNEIVFREFALQQNNDSGGAGRFLVMCVSS